MVPCQESVITSSVGEQHKLSFTMRAYPKPSIINCTLMGMTQKQSVLDIVAFSNLIVQEHDEYVFSLMVNVSGEASYGNYTCSISNGIGEPLMITKTLKQYGLYFLISFQ